MWRTPGWQPLSFAELGRVTWASQGGGDGEHPFDLLYSRISQGEQVPLTGR